MWSITSQYLSFYLCLSLFSPTHSNLGHRVVRGLMVREPGCCAQGTRFEINHLTNFGHWVFETGYVPLLNEPLWCQLSSLGICSSSMSIFHTNLGHWVHAAFHRQNPLKFFGCWAESNPRHIQTLLPEFTQVPHVEFAAAPLDCTVCAERSAREEPGCIHASTWRVSAVAIWCATTFLEY